MAALPAYIQFPASHAGTVRLYTSTASTTASHVWQNWCNSYSYATGGTITGSAWQEWNADYATGTTAIMPMAWEQWNTGYEMTAEVRAERERLLEEQRQRRAAAWERQEAEARREAAERLAAQTRAEELLLGLLTDEQRASYAEHGWFEVRGSRGGRWRIRNHGQAGNVDLMPEIGEVREASYCCHPPGGLPAADAHLAQMLHLVTDEDGFRNTANRMAA